MTNQYNFSDVFISYSRKDKAFAQALFGRLKADNKQVWVDWEDIPPTADWWSEIQAGIDAANTFVFIISPDSIASPTCFAEVEHATKRNKRIIPISHRKVGSEILEKDAHPSIKVHNWVPFGEEEDFESRYRDLIASLEMDLAHTNTHSRLLVRAREWADRNYNAALLLRASELQAAEKWLRDYRAIEPHPSSDHIAFITASRRDSRNRQIITGVTGLVALIVAVLAIFAYYQRQEAIRVSDIAITERDNAARAEAEIRSINLANFARDELEAGNTFLALSLALLANQNVDTSVNAQRVLRDIAALSLATVVEESPTWDNRQSAACPEGYQEALLCTQFESNELEETLLILTHNSLLILHDYFEENVGDTIELVLSLEDDIYESTGGFTKLALSPSGNLLALGSRNGWIMVYDRVRNLRSGLVASPVLSPVQELGFNQDETAVYAALESGQIVRASSISPSQDVLAQGFEHLGSVHQVQYYPQSQQLMSIGMDGNAFEWDSDNLASPLRTMTDFVVFNDWLTDENHWVQLFDTGRILIYGPLSESPIADFTVESFPIAAALSRRSNELAIGDFAGEVLLVDLAAQSVRTVLEHQRPVSALAYTTDGNQLATGTQVGEITLWNSENGSLIRNFTGGHNQRVNAIAFSPDEQYLVSAGEDGTLVVWDLATGNLLKRLAEHTGSVRSLQFAPVTTMNALLSGGSDGDIILWDTATWQSLHRFEEHGSAVISLDISDDGREFVSGSHDARMIRWRLEANLSLVARLMQEREILELTCEQRLAFSVSPLCEPAPIEPIQIGVCEAVVLGKNGVNVRTEPSALSDPIMRGNYLDALLVRGITETNPFVWLELEYDAAGSIGFMRYDFVGLQGDCGEIISTEYLDLAPAPLANYWWVRGHDPRGDIYNTGPHNGWDLGANTGEPVYAADGGYIMLAAFCSRCWVQGSSTLELGFEVGDSRIFRDEQWNYGYGHYVIVRYLNGQLPANARRNLAENDFEGQHIYCLYAHIQEILVKAGNVTSTTKPIALVGNSGNSEAAHLGLECAASSEANASWATIRENVVDPGLIYSRTLRP